MPIADPKEAKDLDRAIERLLDAPSLSDALQQLKDVFAGRLDFSPASGNVPVRLDGLADAPSRVADQDGVHVVAVAVQRPGRVNVSDVRAALKGIRQVLGGDVLLAAADQGRSQWHFIYPTERGGREVLRRMVVEKGQPRRTVVQQLAGIYHDRKAGGDLRGALERAYDVEAVTKKFFQEYRHVFEQVMGLVKGLPDEEECKLFCQALFNRLMFLYFLQRKGWLIFNGNANYLDALWRDAQRQPDENFYDTRLKLLFFNALNNPRTADWDRVRAVLEPRIGRVPFLNGGLFEETERDRFADVVVPNAAIRLILRELFDHYNFTITESTPYDIVVAVDPEMLGKVFEKLVTGRHETGSYYTPRPVVSFMCREALKGYLVTRAPGLSSQVVRAFVEDHDVSGLTVQQARQVLEALESIAVLDPACGSGAYLLGMLHELVELQMLLYNSQLIRDPKGLYDLKLRVIERNVYGADSDKFAVNTAMLRLWLSLVIDYDAPGDPPALPNLDFKIVCGDSLTAPNPAFATDLFRHQVHQDADELARLKAEYMRSVGEEKRVLGEHIAEKHAQLAAMLTYAPAPPGSVDWRVELAEVFDHRGGFDIALANPPYVRADAQFKHIADEDERQGGIAGWQDYRRKLLASRTYETLYEKWDLYIPFLERAYQLLCGRGRMVFIISDAYNAAKYAAKSHKFFLDKSSIDRVDFCSDIPLFEAGVANTILHFAKVPSEAEHASMRVRRWGRKPDDFDANAEFLPTSPQAEFGTALFRVDGKRAGLTATGTVELSRICYISYGLRANADDRYWQGEFTTDDCLSTTKDGTHPKPFVQGKDLVKWWPRRIWYLEWGTARAPRKFSRPTFPELHDAKRKLIAVRTPGATPKVIYDERQLHFDASSVGFVPWHLLKGVRNKSIRKTARYRKEVKPDSPTPAVFREELESQSLRFAPKYLLAVMNATYARDWLAARRRSSIHLYPDDWKLLPVPDATPAQQAEIAMLVDEILGLYEKHGYPLKGAVAGRLTELEREIDGRVKDLYGAAADGASAGEDHLPTAELTPA